MRSEDDGAFERLALIPLENEEGEIPPGAFEVLLFDLEEPTEYFVEAAGVESATFTLDVVDLPYVERLELEYVFPAYTGLEAAAGRERRRHRRAARHRGAPARGPDDGHGRRPPGLRRGGPQRPRARRGTAR